MKFRTELPIAQSGVKINLASRVLSVGSCFAENIGQRLLDNKFNISHFHKKANLLGTVFNPVSIVKSLNWLAGAEELKQAHFVETQTGFRHLDFHSSFHGTTKGELEKQLLVLRETVDFKNQPPDILTITLGTAWIYDWLTSGNTVSNCHKIPNKEFNKRLLAVDEIMIAFAGLLHFLPQKTQIILTVSPVRHLKDTLPLNTVSKSVLRLACHQLTEQFEQFHYFPAYEILLDDLRDYRFFQADMLHPSEQAVDYIWQKFSETYFDLKTTDFLRKWHKTSARLAHRPFIPQSEEYQTFLEKLLRDLQDLSHLVNLEEEIVDTQRKISSLK